MTAVRGEWKYGFLNRSGFWAFTEAHESEFGSSELHRRNINVLLQTARFLNLRRKAENL
jgi:hypothetical protein